MATELLRRDFTVDLPLDAAWQGLADVATWPTWARHLRRVSVTPPGRIGATSTGRLSFRPIGRSAFRISAYDEPNHWEWVGKVAWLTIRYDHRFAANGDTTLMTWTVAEEGSRRSTLGRLFASVYGRLVDRAIPRLQVHLASPKQGE